MKRRAWAFPLSLCVLAAYAALYLFVGENGGGGAAPYTAPRGAALAAQLSTSLTGLTPKLLLAALILGLTAAFGRWHCRLLCPAGIAQELFSRLGAALGLRRLRFAAAPGRAALLAVVGFASLFGMRTLAQITDPIGVFGRLVAPWSGGWQYWAAAIAGAAVILVLPLFKGRMFCDRFCPVGALLGVAARAGGKTPVILAENCLSCGKCATVCPVQCVDPRSKTIVAERCLGCGECARICPAEKGTRTGALASAIGIAGSPGVPATTPEERRSFLTSAVVGAAGVFALSRPVSGAFGRESPAPAVTPPGTGGDARHRQFCVGCQSCVPACPMGIIRPAGTDMRPVLDYDRGFCHYNCTECLHSCPAHAFLPLSLEERQRVRVARVSLELSRCVVLANGTACGACAEVCPTHAVRMAARGEGEATVPDFDPAFCIGCGACYHACPAEPRAFVMRGLNTHETAAGIRPPAPGAAGEEPAQPHSLPESGELTDFPF